LARYSEASAPVCPLGLPGCTGKIKERGAKSCANCYRQSVARKATDRNSPDTVAPATPEQSVEADRQKLKTTSELQTLKAKYAEALKTIERLDRELVISNALDSTIDSYSIEPVKGSGTSEATPIIVASDWHIEERVGSEVGSLNRFSLAIAHARAERFFQSGLRLVQLLNKDVTINTVVLALLGDFITNDIHGAENAELNEVQPIHAIIEAQNMLASGIEFWLEHSDKQLVIVCHSGNHSRTTQTTRFSSENGHSLEFLMYKHLAAYFRHEPRITFIVPDAPHSYLDIYDTTIRFQHGHMIKYGGGVGGIYIPTNKAIAQWNKARHADLDVFGHFHQLRDGGNFLVNGSLIGYNAFALSIKADYEPPKQLLFMMDKKRGRTATWPILLDK
jgi:hypothetical protein